MITCLCETYLPQTICKLYYIIINLSVRRSSFCRLCAHTFEWIIFFEVVSITSTMVVALTMRDSVSVCSVSVCVDLRECGRVWIACL